MPSRVRRQLRHNYDFFGPIDAEATASLPSSRAIFRYAEVMSRRMPRPLHALPITAIAGQLLLRRDCRRIPPIAMR